MVAARAPAPASTATPPLLMCHGDAQRPLSPPPHPLLSLPSSISLAHSHPITTIATTHRCRTQSLPLDPSACPVARLPRPQPPRQAKRRRMPPNALTAIFFNLGPPRSSATVRPLQHFPELAEATERTAMSSCEDPLLPPLRFRAIDVAPLTTVATAA